jgi:hypothetical protein
MPNDQQPALRFEALHSRLSTIRVLKESLATSQKSTVISLCIFIALCFLGVIAIVFATTDNTALLVQVGFFVVFLPVLFLGLTLWQLFKRTACRLRLAQFAADNTFDFEPLAMVGNEPGSIFSMGHATASGRLFEHVVSGEYVGMPFEFGNFRYRQGQYRERARWYGVLRVTLSRRLPNILLDSKQNNRFHISNMPDFKNRQKLQLEGDFNRYFDLYVPKEYERDALYFITPELMALLVDRGAKFDIEIVDNYLYIYSNEAFNLDDEAAVQTIFDLIPRIGSEVEANTKRYADATVGNRELNEVAKPGRRLKRAISWFTILLILWYVYSIFFNN